MAKYYIIFLFCITSLARGQHPSLISYLAPVPLLIRSDLYIDTLGENGSVYLLSPAIKIYRLPNGIAVESDQSFSNGLPIRQNRLTGMEFRVTTYNRTGQWKKLPQPALSLSTPPFGGQLADEIVGDDGPLVLEFRQAASKQVIQRTLFYRKQILPLIRLYHQKTLTDTTDNALASKAVRHLPATVSGFVNFPPGGLLLHAGMDVAFLLAKTSVNLDSSIEYRIAAENEIAGNHWTTSGHLLTIRNLTSNQKYVLELRYKGADNSKTYPIQTLPFWYQQSWATLLFAGIGILLFIVAPYRLYRYRLGTERQKRLQAEQQLKTVQSQLNPHFVFNTLSSIEDLINQGQNEKANEYLTDFSDIMRDTLRNTDLLLISLAEDISMLEKYIRIEQLRFGFHYTIHLEEGLDPDTIDFPPMLLQPSVENAVKHGVSGMGKAGSISIHYEKQNHDLLITIADNGEKKTIPQKPGNGKGMALTQERMKILQVLHQKEHLGYALSHTDQGTLVQFTFQNWLT